MPRSERPIEQDAGLLSQFATGLRALRASAGNPTYRELATRAHYSASTLSEAASGRKLPTLTVTLAYVRACAGPVDEWDQRWRHIAMEQARGKQTTSPLGVDDAEPPYPGLRSFQPEDAARFFGREALVNDLTRRVNERRFLGVFGASGTGKSSLLRAGLLATFSGPSLLVTPGRRPSEECAVAFAGAIGATAPVLRQELLADPSHLHLVVRQVAGDADLLLVVDQFEEVFSVCDDPIERSWFVSALVAAAYAESSRIRVVLGVRADFYAHCGRYPELVDALTDAQMLVGSMSADQLREAATRPATSSGYTMETALVARLVADTAGQPAVLPLLSHALLETWRRRQGMALTLAGYERAGGIEQALTNCAERVHDELDAAGRSVLRWVFVRLTALGDGTEDTKRRATRHELGDGHDTRDVLARLADARLITVGDNSVEVAHEALIRHWPRLREWLSEDRDGLRIHRQLTFAAQEWQSLERDADAVYRGTRLTVATAWAAGNEQALNPLEHAFLDAGRAREIDERTNVRRQTRRVRRYVQALVALLAVVLTATGLAIYAQNHAIEEKTTADSRQTASLARTYLSTDPQRAFTLAASAYHQAETLEARDMLLSVTGALDTETAGLPDQVLTVGGFSNDGGLFVSADQDARFRTWSGSVMSLLASVPAPGITSRSVLVGGKPPLAVLTGQYDGSVRWFDLADPRHPRELPPIPEAESATLDRSGELLAVRDHDFRVRLLDISRRDRVSVIAELPDPSGRVLLGGGLIVTAGTPASRPGRVWALGADRVLRELATLPADIGAPLALSPDGDTLVTVELGTQRQRIWDLRDPAHLREYSSSLSPSAGVPVFSADGRKIAVTGPGATIDVYDFHRDQGAQHTATLYGTTEATGIMFTPDGKLTSVDTDGVKHSWTLDIAVVVRRYDSAVVSPG